MAVYLEQDHTYRLRAYYDPSGYARAALLDESGKKLWDTGEVPAWGPASFNAVHFHVKPGKPEGLKWEADKQAMLLWGRAWSSTINSAGYVDNLEVRCFE